MSEALVGLSTTRELYLEYLGAPVTDAVLTYTLVGPTGTLLRSAVAATNVGAGWYSFALDGITDLSAIGHYLETWAGTSVTMGKISLPRRFFVFYPEGPLVTRQALRQLVAQQLGDLLTGTATGGSGTTLVDTDRAEPDNHWQGAWLYLTGGTGRDQQRRVSASTSSSGTLTVTKAWAVNPAAGTLYELHRSGRWSVDDYNRAINQALLDLARYGLITGEDESIVPSSSTVWEYAIPPGFRYIAAIWQRDTTSALNDWERLSPRTDYTILPGRRVLRLARPAANTRLRLIGQLPPDTLQHDQDYCDLAPDWVVLQAAGHLCRSKMTGGPRDSDGFSVRAQAFLAAAQAQRPYTPVLPNSLRL